MHRTVRRATLRLALALIAFVAASCAAPVQATPGSTSARALTGTGKKVLFDNSHGETAGAADWVIDGGFSDFGDALKAKGYTVAELRLNRALTTADLSGYDVVVFPESNIPLKTTEQQAILSFVQGGGSVFFIADHYNADRNLNRWDAGEVFNGYRRGAFGNPTKGMGTAEANSAAMQGVTSTDWLGTNFGIRFRTNALGDVNATDIVAPSQAFGITAGVSAVAMHAGATLVVLDPTKAKGIVYLPVTTSKWASAVDQGNYAGGGRAEGPFVAVAKIGAGKAGFIGDSSAVEDATPKYKREDTGATKTTYAGWSEVNDATLLTQMIDWLGIHESYTSLSQVAGLTLDSPTPLLAIDDPATSTEPQAEPWAAPPAGYLWYDQTTFASGSYVYPGSGGGTGGTSLTESFDTGAKASYASASVTLASGSWTLADALLGSDANDRFNGVQAVRVRNTGTATMNFNLGGAGTVTVKHAKYGSDGSSTWGLYQSTDGGSTWSQVGSTVTTSTTTLTTATFTVNQSGTVRLQLRKLSGGTNRLDWDDLSVTSY